MRKRWRSPRARRGQLKAQYGKLPHEAPDIIAVAGEGCSMRDANLVLGVFTMKRYSPLSDIWEPSFLESLDIRGYDITTLRFSIEKKQVDQ